MAWFEELKPFLIKQGSDPNLQITKHEIDIEMFFLLWNWAI